MAKSGYNKARDDGVGYDAYRGGPNIDPGPAPMPPPGADPRGPGWDGSYGEGFDWEAAEAWRAYKIRYEDWQQAQQGYKHGFYSDPLGEKQLKFNTRYVTAGGNTGRYGVQTYGIGAKGRRGDRSGRGSRGRGGRGGGGGGIGSDMTAGQKSAFDLMTGLLKQYGLESLGKTLRDLVLDGVTDQASLTLALQDTKEWKTRFIGNEKLKSAGLPVLSVAEYLATERSYAQIMKNFGLPKGFYDDPSDFGMFIGNAVSASELQERVQAYSDIANRQDPAIKEQLRAMGMTEGDLLAFVMDPERANPLIQRKYQTTLIGAAARRTGVATDTAYAERLAGMGITEQQAQAGYSVISESLGDVDKLGDIYGEDYTQRDFESEVFEGDGTATRKRKRLASAERAAFSGQSGVGQGSLRQSSAGQY